MARSRQKKIDHVRWIGFSSGTTGFGLAAGTVAALAISPTSFQETVMRTRGQFSAFVDALQAPGNSAVISVGMVIVPEGTGSSVLWSPFTDRNAPWFYYAQAVLAYEEYVTDVIDSPGMTSFRQAMDSKAMRKAAPDTEIQVVFENTTLGGSGLSVNANLIGRVLIGT